MPVNFWIFIIVLDLKNSWKRRLGNAALQGLGYKKTLKKGCGRELGDFKNLSKEVEENLAKSLKKAAKRKMCEWNYEALHQECCQQLLLLLQKLQDECWRANLRLVWLKVRGFKSVSALSGNSTILKDRHHNTVSSSSYVMVPCKGTVIV